MNSAEEDITQQFIDFAHELYLEGDYKNIQSYIYENDLSISYTVITDIDVISGQDGESDFLTTDSTTMNIRSKNVSESFYKLATDTKDKFTKEWVVTLSGSYSYDSSTYRVTHTNSPVLRLTTANFGAAFSPYLQSITTSSSHSGSTATFRTSYTMMATLGVSIGDLPLGFTLNFGSHSHNFSNHPLQ